MRVVSVKCVYWFRRDLRTVDNKGLYEATQQCDVIYPLVVIDRNIMEREDTSPRRAFFYLQSLNSLREKIPLTIKGGDPVEEVPKFVRNMGASAVFFNRDYGYYATKRDSNVCERVQCITFKDHVLVEPGELPLYKVFTPYFRKWSEVPKEKPYPEASGNFEGRNNPVPEKEDYTVPCSNEECARERVFMEDKGTTMLSPFIKVGLVSERFIYWNTKSERVRRQLCWRDFYIQLYTSDYRLLTNGVRKEIKYDNDPKLIEAWKEGETGIPIVDAAMRELNDTGWMDNRLRLVTSFLLTKVMLVDWRIGALHFMKNLLDGEFIINTANWQWSAGVGVDTRPLRRYNIVKQSKEYDSEGIYIKKWVDELDGVPAEYIHEPHKMPLELQEKLGIKIGKDYPYPVVDVDEGYREFVRRYKEVHENVLMSDSTP
ncbi:cryptochrome/photolyase family protein [Sulfuracidifex tepidarius]|uniref:Photolyase/cryptochrome alpha/beta domain-containing protein n=1 Tax=Sulfuracidifex tepidarius TaxID=1294262 RepID=A0A510E4X4_9CREN|nr:deoxyribodipyrimidine photo-lyase [Sulfuracidifex tepidarius]BBG27539.1 hypothetical protein IC007_2093 [Sulfuracidifex tepidarius]